MDFKKSKHLILALAAAYWTLAIMIYIVAGEGFHWMPVATDALSASSVVGEIVDGMELHQRLVAPAEKLSSLELMADTYGRVNTGFMNLSLINEEGNAVAQGSIDISALQSKRYTAIFLEQMVQIQSGDILILSVTTKGCAPGNAVTLYTGTTVTTGRFDIAQDISESDRFVIDNEIGVGKLCVRLNGMRKLSFYRTYWLIIVGVFAATAALCARWWSMAKLGINNPLVAVCMLYTRYSFLIRQLIGRDFKAKYKRSVLGMLWSFLNPLLTMSVQYVVFSTLFRSDIANFPVYLLCGIVFFNFFNEAVSMGMLSIVSNAALIKKVYVPK